MFVTKFYIQLNVYFLRNNLEGIEKQFEVHSDLPHNSGRAVGYSPKYNRVNTEHRYQNQGRLGQFSASLFLLKHKKPKFLHKIKSKNTRTFKIHNVKNHSKNNFLFSNLLVLVSNFRMIAAASIPQFVPQNPHNVHEQKKVYLKYQQSFKKTENKILKTTVVVNKYKKRNLSNIYYR